MLGLAHYRVPERRAVLFGQIFGVSNGQLVLLLGVAGAVLLAILMLYRPLLFASVDPEVAEARGVPVKLAGLAFLVVLAVTVTEAAQVVGNAAGAEPGDHACRGGAPALVGRPSSARWPCCSRCWPVTVGCW